VTCEVQNPDKIVRIHRRMPEMGIGILPPDVNDSDKIHRRGKQDPFWVGRGENVGDAAIDVIPEERKARGPLSLPAGLLHRVDSRKVNRRVWRASSNAGRSTSRRSVGSQMLAALRGDTRSTPQATQKMKGEFQLSICGRRRRRSRKNATRGWTSSLKSSCGFEKELIVFTITRPSRCASYEKEIKRLTRDDTATLSKRQNGDEVKVCGLVSQLKEIVTKKGDRMGFLSLEDMKGFVEVPFLFPEAFKSALPHLREVSLVLVGNTRPRGGPCEDQATEVRALSEPSRHSANNFHLKIPLATLTPRNSKI